MGGKGGNVALDVVAERVAKLEREKGEAVEREDYDLAKVRTVAGYETARTQTR